MIDGMPRCMPVVIAVLALAGCGGGGDAERRSSKGSPTPTPSPAPRASEAAATPGGDVTGPEVAAIRGWADALRGGDVEKAAGYWALPSTASNGGPAYTLRTRAAVRFFNETLPCGAKLESTERESGFVVATFRLTERPGRGECGSGTGNRVRTAFQIRRGKIKQWVRAPDPEPASEAPGGSTS